MQTISHNIKKVLTTAEDQVLGVNITIQEESVFIQKLDFQEFLVCFDLLQKSVATPFPVSVWVC